MAGIGKSAISRTLCRLLRELGLLGGSFFCSRRSGSSDQRDAKHIIPTLSRALATQSPEFASSLLQAIETDSQVGQSSLAEQFRVLLVVPCAALPQRSGYIIVIDGIDECDNLDDVTNLLALIIEQASSVPVRFLITSRPEAAIRELLPTSDSRAQTILHLHNIEQDTVDEDIHTYLLNKLGHVPERRKDIQFSEPWPSASELTKLTALSDRLFIYASTAYRYISTPGRNPKSRLTDLLDRAPGTSGSVMKDVDAMYSFILNGVFASLENPSERDLMLRSLSTTLCAFRALTLSELAGIVGNEVDDVRASMSDLHSVIYMPDDAHQYVYIFHATFSEYLKDSARSGSHEFSIDVPNFDAHLTSRCLDVMQRQLHFNIANFRSSHVTNQTHLHKEWNYLQDKLWGGLGYACIEWYGHWVRSKLSKGCFDAIASFLQTKFLYWLEVLAACEWLSLGQILIKKLLISVTTVSIACLSIHATIFS